MNPVTRIHAKQTAIDSEQPYLPGCLNFDSRLTTTPLTLAVLYNRTGFVMVNDNDKADLSAYCEDLNAVAEASHDAIVIRATNSTAYQELQHYVSAKGFAWLYGTVAEMELAQGHARYSANSLTPPGVLAGKAGAHWVRNRRILGDHPVPMHWNPTNKTWSRAVVKEFAAGLDKETYQWVAECLPPDIENDAGIVKDMRRQATMAMRWLRKYGDTAITDPVVLATLRELCKWHGNPI